MVVEHELPGRDPLHEIAKGVAIEPGELLEGSSLDAVLDAAASSGVVTGVVTAAIAFVVTEALLSGGRFIRR